MNVTVTLMPLLRELPIFVETSIFVRMHIGNSVSTETRIYVRMYRNMNVCIYAQVGGDSTSSKGCGSA